MSCDFHEPYFGAHYPDACCIDGFLWDLDSCDTPGGPLSSGGEVPCPQCNHDSWLARFEEEIEMEGYEAFEQGEPRIRCHKAFRNEQAGDIAKAQAWFEKGWVEAEKEKSSASGPKGKS